jgi:hypothetical protein
MHAMQRPKNNERRKHVRSNRQFAKSAPLNAESEREETRLTFSMPAMQYPMLTRSLANTLKMPMPIQETKLLKSPSPKSDPKERRENQEQGKSNVQLSA